MINRKFVFAFALVFASAPLFAQEEESADSTDDVTTPAPVVEDAAAQEDGEPSPPLIVIELIQDDREINGVLLDTEDLEVETAFGPAAIPLDKVLGIRLPRSVDDTTTIVLHNGDMITGVVNIPSLLVQTNWGRSEINGGNLASIFFREGLAWESLDLLAGPRWTLVEQVPSAGASVNSDQASALAQQ